MNPEDYVSYSLALALKKHGFDWECRDFYWTSDGTFKHTDAPVHKNSEHCTTMVAAPTLCQAQKWLREKGIHISVNPYMGYDVDADGALYNEYPSWVFELMDVASADFMNDAGGNHTSYELALSAGIAAALELIGNN